MATLDVLTLREAKETLNLVNTAAHDVELPLWVTAVSLKLDDLVGPVVKRAITDNHDGGRHILFLTHYPVSSVTSVTEYDDTTATTLTEETNASKPTDSFILDPYKPDPTLSSNRIRRRSEGYDGTFTSGRNNIVVTYQAGRFADTSAVDERFKTGARLMLLNLWRSQQDSTGQVGEYDVPQSLFPRVTVPDVVRDMFRGELQEPGLLVA